MENLTVGRVATKKRSKDSILIHTTGTRTNKRERKKSFSKC